MANPVVNLCKGIRVGYH